MSPKAPGRPQSHGAVLIVGLVVLLVMTLLGVSALQTTVLQERMTGNLRQTDLAFQAAEAALQAGLTYLARQTSPPPVSTTAGTTQPFVWKACSMPASDAESIGSDPACTRRDEFIEEWVASPTTTTKGKRYDEFATVGVPVTSLPRVAAPPRVYIESRHISDPGKIAGADGTHYYTVTAIGFGESPQAIAILESTIARRYR